MDASLRRLQLDHIDLYQVHGQDLATPLEETLRALEDLVRSGKVRYLGLSNYAAWQIMKGVAISERRGWNRFESIQVHYSLAGRDIEREIVPVSLDQALGILVWSPLAGGLLSGKFSDKDKGPEGARRTNFDFPPVDRARAFRCVDAMRPIAQEHGVSVARSCAGVVAAPAGRRERDHRREDQRTARRQHRCHRLAPVRARTANPEQRQQTAARVPGLDVRAAESRSTSRRGDYLTICDCAAPAKFQ